MRNETSLSKKQDFKQIYDGVLQEYETLDHMVRIDSPSDEKGFLFALPRSFKARVVLNGSSKIFTAYSLSDALYLIISWRFTVLFSTVTSRKMYRHIWSEMDQIVFKKNPKNGLQNFELTTVTFGINCAPFLAIRTLLQLASDVETELPLSAKILLRMMYVDDAQAVAHDIEIAKKAREQLLKALSSAGFSMKQWTSNVSHSFSFLMIFFFFRKSTMNVMLKHWGYDGTPKGTCFTLR